MNKKQARLKRAKRSRMKMKELEIPRLCVHRTPRHIYAQIISGEGGKVLVCASTVEKSFRESSKKSMILAQEIGKLIAKRAQATGVKTLAFDRSGFKYHGRIKALAEAAREGGLEF